MESPGDPDLEHNNVGANNDIILECIDLLVYKYPEMIHQRDDRQLLPFQVAIISKMEEAALKLISMASDDEIITEKAGDYTSLSIAAGIGIIGCWNILLGYTDYGDFKKIKYLGTYDHYHCQR